MYLYFMENNTDQNSLGLLNKQNFTYTHKSSKK